MENMYLENSKIFKAFCDETRLRVLELLQSGEKCACVLLEKVKIKQPTLSHHMKILVESGIVNARKEGKWMYYSINEKNGRAALLLLRDLLTVVLSNCCTENNLCAENNPCTENNPCK